MPTALIGGETHNENGERFCYGFNLGTCSNVKPGEQCERGWHKCMHKQCKQNHAFINHK